MASLSRYLILKKFALSNMAIKIINPKPAKSVLKTRLCKNCGVKLEYAPNDVKEHYGTDYGGGPDGQKWIDCPNCSKRVILESW